MDVPLDIVDYLQQHFQPSRIHPDGTDDKGETTYVRLYELECSGERFGVVFDETGYEFAGTMQDAMEEYRDLVEEARESVGGRCGNPKCCP
jgi:hypothetical protein